MRGVCILALILLALLHARALAATSDPCANVRAFNALTLDCQSQSARGNVVDLDIDSNFLSGSPQVTAVALLNMNIGDRISDVASMLPEDMEVLDLTNTKLTVVPRSLDRFMSLDKITLANNYLLEWPATFALPKLKALNLQGNDLKTFNTSLMTLTTLDLSANNLTEIPPAVYTLSTLKVLKLKGNPIQRLRLSFDQHSFLRQLEEFELDPAAFDATNCPPINVQTLGGASAQSVSLWEDELLLSRQLRYEDIDDIRLIGSGGHGVVWLVNYRQSRLLASKRLIRDQVTRQKTMELVAEIKLVAHLEHPSIVSFVGVAWTVETDLQALFEYMPNGDLRSHLEATDAKTQWSTSKLQMAMDVIEALVYVHSFNPPLVHRDLKSRNVLLTEDMRAKLSDFGVSRFQSENATMTTGVGTGKWLAPEVIAGSKSYDQSCDIYSFGVLLSELDTHQLPYEDVRGAQGNRLPEVAILQNVATGRLQPTLLPTCPPRIRSLAMQCMSFRSADRPTAMQVAYTFHTLLREHDGE
ncbi:hypothetical protein P43SY_001538 [Pythium insidiosum]|uniref:Protein kinase domain-containing protein n=1 Tax=Pythium insidiosum TaxID=114742 RepID=A0AAD5LIL5_PYTIN|nr:hypothetical protein P43SY_001538 [Pythium insidiosum]